jgi:hypothetical protein
MSIDEMLGKPPKLPETNQGTAAIPIFSLVPTMATTLGDYSMMQGKQTPFDIDIGCPSIVCGPMLPRKFAASYCLQH